MGGLVTFPHMALKAGTVTQLQFMLGRQQNDAVLAHVPSEWHLQLVIECMCMAPKICSPVPSNYVIACKIKQHVSPGEKVTSTLLS